MHPRLLSDLADLEIAASRRAAADRRTRRDVRRAARTAPARRRRRSGARPADTRPAR